jgi:SAM-dependent methyltransferase
VKNILRNFIIRILRFLERQTYAPGCIGILINPLFILRYKLFITLKPYFQKLTGKVLDFGCGSSPYKSLISFKTYTGLDFENEGHPIGNSNIDVFYDGKEFPFNDSYFDSVICTEVLEHLPDDKLSMNEIYRVLKPGGKLLISVPFIWNEHEIPYDYRRYSYMGLSQLLENCGFKVLEINKTTRFFHTFTQLFTNFLHVKIFTRFFLLNYLINIIFIAPFNILGWLLGFIIPDKNKSLPLNIVILAEK